ncbi:polysaccharide biosynthesis/export family protein [Microbulbifer pacificus]|uniref:Polysaccharide biosynthesis/export family protein n=1 Tax=Microbulbifer pacificus TaxID=407164 RepID=A0AAU0MXS2_9GAMM|nr:polysaccharide biosynthesis/export family protein [Microbulbifer pacificus]WOX04847.1 polysaccharide biosynthesis/export family protein [Microbulbifer pacificus]
MSVFSSLMQRVYRAAFVLSILIFASAVQADELTRGDYQLGSGDKILISVYGEEDLTIETILSDSGVINYPFLGELKVAGLTLSGLENLIVGGLKGDYLVNPNVHVSMLEYRPFFINGEVVRPGGYPFQPGLSISKAAALAQGFTERASESKIYIVRGDDPTQARVKAELNTKLRPGDIVTVEQSFF